MTYYKQKFLKYKLKYQQLLKQKGGMETDGLSEERKKEILDYFEELIPEKIKTLNEIEAFLNNDPNLVELYLWNNISSVGATNIADALKYNTTLESLGLDGNNIGGKGAVALAKALKHNNTLKTLELNSCNIDAVGGVALADALKYNTTVESLALDGNNIGNTGGRALVEALKDNTTITHLESYGNSINDMLQEKIDKIVFNNLSNFEAKKKMEKKEKQIEYLSILKPPQVSTDLPERGVGLFIVGKESGHESSAYGTCYILKSRLGVERCEFIYTERPTKKGDRITGGSENLELLIQLEEKLINLIENRYTHLYLFMECHGGRHGYCSHELNEGGAFTINLLIKIWKKYYDSWKSAIFICDSCASNLLIEQANLPDVNAKNIIGFGVPGQCEVDISKGQLRIIKAITFSAIHALTLGENYDVKTFIDLLKTTWNVWRDSNLHSSDNFFGTQIFHSNINEIGTLKISNPGNPNTSGDYKPLVYTDENQLGPGNSAFNAGWKPLIFWWLTTLFNDINDDEDELIINFIRNKYQNGDDIKIWYSGTKNLITTALEISKQNKTKLLQNRINLLKLLFKNNFPVSAPAPAPAPAPAVAPIPEHAPAPPKSLQEWCTRYDVDYDKFIALFKKYPSWPNLYKLPNTVDLVKKWIIEFLGDDAVRVIKIIEGKKEGTESQFDILNRLYRLTLSHLIRP